MAVLGSARVWIRRLAARLRRDRLDDELREEIAQHLEMRRQRLVDQGMNPRDADSEARRQFGNVTVVREQSRELWGFQWIETLAQDVRFGARLLRRSPVFTFATVASLAIGIGAAAAVFSLADGLLFRALPVRAADELVVFRWSAPRDWPFESLNGTSTQTDSESSSTSFSLNTYNTMKASLSQEIDLFAFADLYGANLSVDGRADLASAHVVSGEYFSVLGVAPAAGRLLGPPDDRPGAPAAAVIGFDLWRRRFGGASEALGRLILLNGVSFTIVGVLPRGFNGTMQVGQACDVMVPISAYEAVTRSSDSPANPNYWWVLMMGRLKPGVTRDRIQGPADLVLKRDVIAAMPKFPEASLPRLIVEPGALGQAEARNEMREPLKIMAGVVTVVLLVACANVASLLLARGRVRAREVAVRTAIGASRLRIVRQLLTEGMLLGLLASGAGLVLAQWISSALLPALSPDSDALTVHYALDSRILAFTCGLGVACSVLFALFPALKTADAGLAPALQEGSRGTIGGRHRFPAGGALVVGQVALSLLLLSAATLLVWSAGRLQRINPGFDPENLLTFSVDSTLNGYDEVRSRAFVRGTLDALQGIPGVLGASVTSHRLIANSSSVGISRPEGVAPMPPDSAEARQYEEKNRTWRQAVDDRFFETFRIPLRSGRSFPPTVQPDAPGIAVVNETLARQLFGTTDVVGRRFMMGLRPGIESLEIVGVAADAHYTSLRRAPPPTAYFPYQQAPAGRVTFAVRTSGDPLALADTVRETLRGIDPLLPIFGVRSQAEQIRRSLAQERLVANLALLLGSVALALSGIGLYGLLAYAVTRRTPEIGVRIALGAERRQVRWMVLRQSLALVAAGVAIGIPAARASTRYLESLLVGLSPNDPRALAAAATVMVAMAFAAAYVPARRASRVDPLTALRAD